MSNVKASSKPENSCYGIWDVNESGTVIDPDLGGELKFETYNDALEGLSVLGYEYWNPEVSVGFKDKPKKPGYVCYVDLPVKPKTMTETG